MRRNNNKSPMGAIKVASIILSITMAFCLTACGNSNEGAGMPTESNPTISEVPGVDEPGLPIVPGGDVEIPTETTEPTAPTADGAYTYTIYGDITISMDVNIDDYIGIGSGGYPYISLGRLFEDYGWVRNNPGESEPEYVYYAGDMAVVFSYYAYPEPASFEYTTTHCYQIQVVNYVFVNSNDLSSQYYGHTVSDNNRGLTLLFARHNADCEYVIEPSPMAVGSRDDIIMLAYLVSSVDRNIGEQPFYCDENLYNALSRYGSAANYYANGYDLP